MKLKYTFCITLFVGVVVILFNSLLFWQKDNQQITSLKFSDLFQQFIQQNQMGNDTTNIIQQDISHSINAEYFYFLIQRFVKNILLKQESLNLSYANVLDFYKCTDWFP